MNTDPNCIFCKIVAGQIPSKKAFEDEDLIAFHDIHPWATVHLLVIPKRHIATMVLAPKLMADAGVTGGFRQVINTGRDGGQEVFHLHMHVFGGPRPWAKG